MAEYYFLSQLPSLDGIGDNMPVPITEERFLELCHRYLGKKAQCELEKLTLVPPGGIESTGSALIDAWNMGERDLRLALARVRADKMKKAFDAENKSLPAELMKTAQMAVDMESPLEAEKFLSEHRMKFLETLRPLDAFSEDAVFYYGLKLKLLLRLRQFDKKLGEAVYQDIYTSIVNGDRTEVVQ